MRVLWRPPHTAHETLLGQSFPKWPRWKHLVHTPVVLIIFQRLVGFPVLNALHSWIAWKFTFSQNRQRQFLLVGSSDS